jgi:hypothetical protein
VTSRSRRASPFDLHIPFSKTVSLDCFVSKNFFFLYKTVSASRVQISDDPFRTMVQNLNKYLSRDLVQIRNAALFGIQMNLDFGCSVIGPALYFFF